MQSISNPALTTGNLNGLTLKNRLIKAGTFENLSPNGIPGTELLNFHKKFARGGIAMTTIGYCAVENAGRLNANMLTMHEDYREDLRLLVQGIQDQGCKVSGVAG